MSVVQFNIHNYPKLKIAAEIDGEFYSHYIRKNGFRTIEFIAVDDVYSVSINTHTLSEREFFLFSIKWS